MDDNCGEWVECIGVASGCGEQEAGIASRSGWKIWVWLVGVVVRWSSYYISLLLFVIFAAVSLLFVHFFYVFLFQYFLYLNFICKIKNFRSINTHTGKNGRPTAAI